MTCAQPITATGEAELVSRARQRDESALRTIIQQNNRRLYRVIRGIVGRSEDAEDILQDTYLRAFAALDDFRGDSALSTWLTRIAANEALGRLRRAKASAVIIEPETAEVIPFPGNASAAPDPERAMAQHEIVQLLEDAIDRLPAEYRTVLVARTVEGMSVEETAAALGLKPETVKTRLFRARALLKDDIALQIDNVSLDAFPFAGKRCASFTDAVISRLKKLDRA